jgi:shikimate dehydrogenase
LLSNLSRDFSVSLLGSGGIARAFVAALSELGFTQTRIVSRNQESGQKLADDFGFQWQKANPDPQSDVLINATPIGMAPHHGPNDPLPFSEAQIAGAKWIIDSVAFPQETRLARISKDYGKNVITGFEITILQALEQFKLYTGVSPTPEQARRAAAFASTS